MCAEPKYAEILAVNTHSVYVSRNDGAQIAEIWNIPAALTYRHLKGHMHVDLITIATYEGKDN